MHGHIFLSSNGVMTIMTSNYYTPTMSCVPILVTIVDLELALLLGLRSID